MSFMHTLKRCNFGEQGNTDLEEGFLGRKLCKKAILYHLIIQ